MQAGLQFVRSIPKMHEPLPLRDERGSVKTHYCWRLESFLTMDLRGLEPLTSTMPLWRSPN